MIVNRNIRTSTNGVVGIVTKLRLGDRENMVRIPVGAGDFSLLQESRRALDFTPYPIQRVPRVISPGLKRPNRRAEYFTPIHCENKKERSSSFTSNTLKLCTETNVPTLCADCVAIPTTSTSWSPKDLSRPVIG
jgi:hypothetical protein